MQLWHGVHDDVLRYPNFQEQIDQWTNVNGTDQVADYTDAPQANWTRTRYGGTGGQALVEAISMGDQAHNIHPGTITNVHNGLCLDASGAGTAVLWACNGGSNQRWTLR